MSLAEILYENRMFVKVILGIPVLGMLLAFVLILYTRPNNMLVALMVIFFVAVQYIVMIFFWGKRVETLAKKSNYNKKSNSNLKEERKNYNSKSLSAIEESTLLPEEERIFPIDKKEKQS